MCECKNILIINSREFRKESFVQKAKEVNFEDNCYYQLLDSGQKQFYTPTQFKERFETDESFIFFNKLIPLDSRDVEDKIFIFTIKIFNSVMGGYRIDNPMKKTIKVVGYKRSELVNERTSTDSTILVPDLPTIDFYRIYEDGREFVMSNYIDSFN